MTDIIRGGVLLQETVRILNDICIKDGGIETDDDRIWANWLHLLDNADWSDIYASLDGLRTDSPWVFYPADDSVFERAKEALTKSISQGKDFVGKPKIKASGNKNLAWQSVMRIREVVNRYRGDKIPNNPPSKYEPIKTKTSKNSDKPTPLFNELFQ